MTSPPRRVVVVTGASSGIGHATAAPFAETGAATVLVGRDRDRLAEVAASTRDAVAVRADITEPAASNRIVTAAIDALSTSRAPTGIALLRARPPMPPARPRWNR